MTTSLPDLTTFFEQYETFTKEADSVFKHIRSLFPAEVTCVKGCASCCHALFDLSLVESLYLNMKFNEKFTFGSERSHILELADSADRKLAKLKRQFFRDSRDGKESNEILQDVAALTQRCPLLDDDNRCIMYEYRPVTCRFYGVPTSIGGKAHTCGKTGFEAGKQYPSVFLDKMQEKLTLLSVDLAKHLESSYLDLASMYVPVSTALLTTYDAKYLGIGGLPDEKDS